MTDAVWVKFGPGIPCGARVAGSAGEDRVWIDMCALGQHVPQMYHTKDLNQLTREQCARLALCEDCLGYGDLSATPGEWPALARRIDEVATPCPNCGGSGRPAVRCTASQDDAGTITGGITFVPHVYVPPLEVPDPDLAALFEVSTDMCMACGNARGFAWRGKPLHAEEAG